MIELLTLIAILCREDGRDFRRCFNELNFCVQKHSKRLDSIEYKAEALRDCYLKIGEIERAVK